MNTKYPPQSRGVCWCGPGGAWAAAVLAGALLATAAPARGESGGPTVVTTQVGDKSVTVTIGGAPGAAAAPEPVKSMADRITITEMEKTVLEAVRDNTRQIDETGRYVALGIAARAAGNVQLDPEEWSQLDRPAYVSLLAEPKRWRGRPMQTTARIFRVTRLMSGDGLNYSEFWPKDRPAWRMDGVQSGPQGGPSQPIIIFSAVNPAEFLDRGEKGAGKNETEYRGGPHVRVAAIFYKDLIDTDRDGVVRTYPVVMAWQLSRGEEALAGSGEAPGSGLMAWLAPVVVLVLALLGGFCLLRRWLMQMRKGDQQGPRYQPLRTPARQAGAADVPADPTDGYVDPDLAAAVEQYRHSKGHDETEGTSGAAGTNRQS